MRSGLSGGDGTRAIDVRAIANGGSGITFDGLGGHLVRGCTAADNGLVGIAVSESSIIVESVARNNGDRGFIIKEGSLLVDSVARNNTSHGLWNPTEGGYRGQRLQRERRRWRRGQRRCEPRRQPLRDRVVSVMDAATEPLELSAVGAE